MGNVGLYLVQDFMDHPGFRITEGPLNSSMYTVSEEPVDFSIRALSEHLVIS